MSDGLAADLVGCEYGCGVHARRPLGLSDDVLHRLCDSAARRIARRLDDAFKEVAVTAILAEHCDDPSLLAHRLLARLRERELFAEAVTVPWQEIAHTPIAA